MTTATSQAVSALTDANANPPKQRNVAFGKFYNSLDNIPSESQLTAQIKSSTIPLSLKSNLLDSQLTLPKVYHHQLFLCQTPANSAPRETDHTRQPVGERAMPNLGFIPIIVFRFFFYILIIVERDFYYYFSLSFFRISASFFSILC
jgi:hypothetical protein